MIDIHGTQRFHGHMCPGLAIGIRMAEIALREIGPHSTDEEVVAIVETDMCGVDAIQYLTGCKHSRSSTYWRRPCSRCGPSSRIFGEGAHSELTGVRRVWRDDDGDAHAAVSRTGVVHSVL